MIELDQLREARERVAGGVHRTPLLSSQHLSERVGCPVWLKAEHLQKTGSFKTRGALNFLLQLSEEERRRGVTTISAGNHAQAVAWAAAQTTVPATVVMPESAPRAKVEASRAYGARVILHGTVFEAFELALDLAQREGLTFVHPFDDPRIIAGQATVGAEILEQLPDVRTIVVPLGGGGLCSGVASWVGPQRPEIDIYGVEPTGAAAMRASLDQGHAVRLDAIETIADGLGAPMAGELTYPIIESFAKDVVLVSDDEIRAAMRFVLQFTKQLLEPAGAAGVAALLEGRLPDPQGPVVIVLSGGNVDVGRLAGLVSSPSTRE